MPRSWSQKEGQLYRDDGRPLDPQEFNQQSQYKKMALICQQKCDNCD